MLFFLDVVSPIPEFSLIDDNKLIFNQKIVSSENDKLSDNIIQKYIYAENQLKFSKYLKKAIITTGPGSYTSLRVGASFLSGITISKDLPLCQISAGDILQIKKETNNSTKIAIFIYSGNSQKFLCKMNDNNQINYSKIENDHPIQLHNIKKVFYNQKKINSFSDKLIQNKFSFLDEILANYENLVFFKNKIIQPKYISNNTLLN